MTTKSQAWRNTTVSNVPSSSSCKLSTTVHLCLLSLSRYYETDHALKSHWRSKVHKRRCKQLQEPAYSIEEAEKAAGLGREGKRPIRGQIVDAEMSVATPA